MARRGTRTSRLNGSLIDLDQRNVPIPAPVVIDTNVVVALLLISSPPPSVQSQQAEDFFARLLRTDQQVILTPTAFSEFVHIAITSHYRSVFHREGRAALSRRHDAIIRDGRDLFKHDPSILQRHAVNLAHLRESLIAANVVIIDPEQLAPIASGRTHQQELLHVVSHYGVDTSDALILMEASRLGVRAIVTMDQDMQRARADFDIHTWL